MAGTLVFFAFNFSRPFGLYDEGMEYLLARAHALGESLFETFQVIYPLGRYIWFGAWIDLFGDELWVLRLANAVLGGVLVAVLYGTVKRSGCSEIAWAVAVAAATIGVASPATLASTLVFSVALFLATSSAPTRRTVLVTAVLAGCLAAWRSDSFVLMCLLAGLGVVRRRRPMELATVVVPGILLGFLPWLVIAAANGEALLLVRHLGSRLLDLPPRLVRPEGLTIAFALPNVDPWHSPRDLARFLFPLVALIPPLLYLGLLLMQIMRWRRGLAIQIPILVAAAVATVYLPQLFFEKPDVWHLRSHIHLFLGVVGVAGVLLDPRWRSVLRGVLLASAVVTAIGIVAQHRLADPKLYPTATAERIGACLERGAPPWAGLPRSEGETLIVLAFGAGWYILEDLEPGTRFLYPTHLQHLSRPELQTELASDVSARSNRWVITVDRAALPAAAGGTLKRHYERLDSWQGWVLWQHRARCPWHSS